mgnify:FL=1
MAKQENVTEEVTGGLSTGITFGAAKGAREPGAGGPPQGGAAAGAGGKGLTKGYKAARRMEDEAERRSYRMNVLIKPSTAAALDWAVKKGEIQSKNDLINYLLERYFAEEGRL